MIAESPRERGLQRLSWFAALLVMLVVEATAVQRGGAVWFIAVLSAGLAALVAALVVGGRVAQLLVRLTAVVAAALGIVSGFSLGGALLLAAVLLGHF